MVQEWQSGLKKLTIMPTASFERPVRCFLCGRSEGNEPGNSGVNLWPLRCSSLEGAEAGEFRVRQFQLGALLVMFSGGERNLRCKDEA